MKTALIATLLVTGCAVQPPYQTVTAPAAQPRIASYTHPVSRYNDCIEALSGLLAYARTGGPVLQKCFAGDQVQCGAFVLFRDGIDDQLRTDDAMECVKTGAISPDHPLMRKLERELPPFTRQLERFGALRRSA